MYHPIPIQSHPFICSLHLCLMCYYHQQHLHIWRDFKWPSLIRAHRSIAFRIGDNIFKTAPWLALSVRQMSIWAGAFSMDHNSLSDLFIGQHWVEYTASHIEYLYYNYKYCQVLYDTGYISELVDICESLSQTVPLVADEVFLVADICWPLFIRTMAFDPLVTLVNCNWFGLAIAQQ